MENVVVECLIEWTFFAAYKCKTRSRLSDGTIPVDKDTYHESVSIIRTHEADKLDFYGRS